MKTDFLETKGFHANLDVSWQTNDKADRLVALGVGLVRLPYTTLGDNLCSVMNRLLIRGIKVVLDYHPNYADSFEAPWKCIQRGRDTERWLQKNYMPEVQHLVALGILNEPRARYKGEECPKEIYPSEWTMINQISSIGIWDINPERVVVIAPPLADIDYLNGFEFEAFGPTIVDIHDYRPYLVANGTLKEYPPKDPKKENFVMLGAAVTLKDVQFTYDDYKHRELHFGQHCNWCNLRDCTPWIGEVGCKFDVEGRELFMKDVKDMGQKFNVRSCFWAYGDRDYGATELSGEYWNQVIRP